MIEKRFVLPSGMLRIAEETTRHEAPSGEYGTKSMPNDTVTGTCPYRRERVQ